MRWPRPYEYMKLRYLFIAIMALQCVFLAIPNDIQWNSFVDKWTDNEMIDMNLFQFVYRGFDLLVFAIVVGVFWAFLMRWILPTPDRIYSVGAFLLMRILDFIDFLVEGNSAWWYVGRLPITANVFMLGGYWLVTLGRENEEP